MMRYENLYELKCLIDKELETGQLSKSEEIDLRNILVKLVNTLGKGNDTLDFNPTASQGHPIGSQSIEKQSPGSFSVDHQQTSELANQVGRPEKVLPKTLGGDDVTLNKEPYFEKQVGPEKVYLQEGEKPPNEEEIKTGKQGGKFYIPSGGAASPQLPTESKPAAATEYVFDHAKELAYRNSVLNQLRIGSSPKLKELQDTFAHETINGLKDNADSYLGQYEKFFDATTFNKARVVIYRIIQEGAKDAVCKPKDLQELIQDSTDKLVYQEAVAWQTQLSDHGIRHIYGNINFSSRIITALNMGGIKFTQHEQLMNDVIMVNHDMGYTSELIRNNPIPESPKHPLIGRQSFEEEKDLFAKFFSDDDLKKMGDYIQQHNDSDIDWDEDKNKAVICISDNLSIFHEEKLPSLFKYIEGSLDDLFSLQQAMKNNDHNKVVEIKAKLVNRINQSNLPQYTKSWLTKAAEEVGPNTPRFTIPMLLGKVGEFSFTKEEGLHIDVDEDPADERVADYFSMGQDKYAKMAKDFGANIRNTDHIEFAKQGKAIVTIEIHRHPNSLLKPETVLPPEEQVVKSKEYLGAGEKPPEGIPEQRGKQGGRFYDTVAGDSKTFESPVQNFNKTLTSAIEQYTNIIPKNKDLKYSSTYEIVQKNGRFFTSSSCNLPKQKDKECYRNAAMLAIENPELTYCEGLATIPQIEGMLFSHAWCVDHNGKVIDNTWQTPGTAYFGIPFATDYLMKVLLKTKVYGIIPDYPRKGYNPFAEGFPDNAIKTNIGETKEIMKSQDKIGETPREAVQEAIPSDEIAYMKRKYEETEKGFDPEEDDDTFYKSIDSILGIEVEEKMAHLVGSEHKLPRGTKTIAENSEREIYTGLRKTVNNWFDTVNKDTDTYAALANLKMGLMKWNNEAKNSSADTIQELYNRGLAAGIKKGTKAPEEKSMKHTVHKATSIGPALDDFRDHCYNNLSNIVKRHVHDGEHALYREKRDIDSWLRKQRYQTKLMVKTEVAKIANLGLIEGWSTEDDKYMYNYFWNAIDDSRTKEISRIRKSGNPYTADEIEWLWENQEQLLPNGKFQGDQYNQRCHISRHRIDKEFKGNRFVGREGDFRRTL